MAEEPLQKILPHAGAASPRRAANLSAASRGTATDAEDEREEGVFRAGGRVNGRKAAPAELKLIKPGANPWYEVRIAEGRQNQIRLMFKYFGRLVEKLRRVKIAFLELDLPPGRYRVLTPKEIERFRKLLKMEEAQDSSAFEV